MLYVYYVIVIAVHHEQGNSQSNLDGINVDAQSGDQVMP
jgi:hypothetical protein